MQVDNDVGGGREIGDVELALFRQTAPQVGDDVELPLSTPESPSVAASRSSENTRGGTSAQNPSSMLSNGALNVLSTDGETESTHSSSPSKTRSPFARYGTQSLARYSAPNEQYSLDPYRPPDALVSPSRSCPTSRATRDRREIESHETDLGHMLGVMPNSAPASLDSPMLDDESSTSTTSRTSTDLRNRKHSGFLRNNDDVLLASASSRVQPGSEKPRANRTQDNALNFTVVKHEDSFVPEENWRDAITRVCADMLGKSLKELEHEFTALGVGHGAHAPRDLADYTIMSTLKSRDAFAMQNAPSWLFNTMDRSGAGFVLRDEFVRYAPFMSPMADSAVAGLVFDELIRAQVNAQACAENDLSRKPSRDSGSWRAQAPKEANKGFDRSNKQSEDAVMSDGSRSLVSQIQKSYEYRDKEMYPVSAALRYDTWKQYFDSIQQKYSVKDDDWDRVKIELGLDPSERLIKSQGAVDHSDTWPTLGKLYVSQRYLVFFAAVGRNHYVARLGAIASVGVRSLPLLMRDCITVHLESETQAAMNGVSAPVNDCGIVLERLSDKKLRTDHVMAEATRADEREKLSPTHGSNGENDKQRESQSDTSGGPKDQEFVMSKDSNKREKRTPRENAKNKFDWNGFRGRQEDRNRGHQDRKQAKSQNGDSTLPQHVWTVMKQFTAGGKPLVFSLIEFRETTRRDHWMALIKEMAAAHRLHLKLGFGSLGRVAQKSWNVVSEGSSALSPECLAIDEVSFGVKDNSPRQSSSDIGEIVSGSHFVYLTSPFRNEPPPPLLAVAAHANVVRYRAVKLVPGARNPTSLLVFSHPDRQTGPISWYVDAVRAHDSWAGRSWIERAMDAIRENMELNKRVYNVQDDEPFDVGRLGEGMGKLAHLCTPLVHAAQFFSYIVQWRNPPATVLAFCASMYILVAGWVPYLPAATFFTLAGVVVATKVDAFGLEIWLWGDTGDSDKSERHANVLEIVSQVHETLHATQNIIKQINLVLGKLRTLCLWKSEEEWKSWVAVGGIFLTGTFLYIASTTLIYLMAVLFLFAKHFLPPDNPLRRFWASIPADSSRLQLYTEKRANEKRANESRKAR